MESTMKGRDEEGVFVILEGEEVRVHRQQPQHDEQQATGRVGVGVWEESAHVDVCDLVGDVDVLRVRRIAIFLGGDWDVGWGLCVHRVGVVG